MKSEQAGLKVYVRLLKTVLRFWPAFAIGIFGTVLSSGTDAGFTWFLKPLVNKGFIDKDTHFITWLPLIILVAFVIRGSASFLADYFLAYVGRNVVMNFRQELFAKYLVLPTDFYDKTTTGQMLSLMLYNVEQIAKATTKTLIIIVREVCLIAGLCYVMFTNSWRLTLIFVFTAPIIAMVVIFCSRRMRMLSRNIQGSVADITHYAEEGILGQREIKSFAGQDYESQKFNSATKKNYQREMKVVVTDSLSTSLVQIIAALTIAGILYLATSSTHYGINAGAFVSMIAAMLAILKPMKTLTTVNSTIQKGIAAAEDIFATLAELPERDEGVNTLTQPKGNITFRAVNFQYEASTQAVLQDINFDLPAGKQLALVGRSGAGKTTLASLLPRFYDCLSGEICIDGVPIQTLSLDNLRRHIAIVTQDVVLFNDTIANNIAYGQLGNTDEETIIKAAKAAHAWSFICDLPDGLHTQIGEDGVLLSGGQRQRLAIARAILKDAPILILDEATASLDTEAERHIQAALTELMKNKTSIVIAHRLSTIEHADMILVMEQGRVIESGDHQTLLAQQGAYANFYHLQFKSQAQGLK